MPPTPSLRRASRGRLAALAVGGTVLATAVPLAAGIGTAASAATVAPVHLTARTTSYVDSSGNTWAPDEYYVGGSRSSTTAGFGGTSNPELYRTQHYGMSAYRIPVAGSGTYEVKLYLAETYWRAAGKRVFDITAEGAVKASNVDIYKASGARDKAYQIWFPVNVTDGVLDLGFVRKVDLPTIGAIAVEPTSVTSTTTPTSTSTPTATATAASKPTASPTATTTSSPTATTTSSPTATATTASPPLWKGDYDGGDFSQFQSTSWNDLPLAPALSTNPVRAGAFAGKYVVPAGGSRSENVPNTPEFSEGNDRWFSFSTRLGSDVPLSTSNWQVIAQWKNDGDGSPPLALCIDNGRFKIGGGFGWPGTNSPTQPKEAYQYLGAATAGNWDDWVIHVKFSADPSVGYIDVWRNGTQLVSGWHLPGGTLYPSLNSYLKVGYYRSSAISQSSTVYHDSWKVGTSRSSVG